MSDPRCGRGLVFTDHSDRRETMVVECWRDYEDEELVVQALLGKIAAFDELVLRYRPAVLAAISRQAPLTGGRGGDLPGGVPPILQSAVDAARPQPLPRLAARHRAARSDP